LKHMTGKQRVTTHKGDPTYLMVSSCCDLTRNVLSLMYRIMEAS
jgi:hypothetical protein